jgi:hypothetical protein
VKSEYVFFLLYEVAYKRSYLYKFLQKNRIDLMDYLISNPSQIQINDDGCVRILYVLDGAVESTREEEDVDLHEDHSEDL